MVVSGNALYVFGTKSMEGAGGLEIRNRLENGEFMGNDMTPEHWVELTLRRVIHDKSGR